ncbi:DUF814 domain-containing protein [Candidatus Woesearchaeota archaeon]|nr:DUF814 domain-containing protein [Candidatus Woesearchaeota archaeon]
MTQLTLYLDKSLEENAGIYFDKAKKAKKKIEGATKALEIARQKLAELMAKQQAEDAARPVKNAARKKEWYEKFRWFYTSDGLLVIGGRDAATNEMVIKKHTEKRDLVLHTDMAGSPFFVIKAQGKDVPLTSIEEAADATCSFSKAWKLGLGMTSVFYVDPEQVSKEANPGEYMGKGAFMIRGKTHYAKNRANLALGIFHDAIMAGPQTAITKHCSQYLVVVQGDDKPSDVAKKIKAKLGFSDLDEIIRALPAGGAALKK